MADFYKLINAFRDPRYAKRCRRMGQTPEPESDLATELHETMREYRKRSREQYEGEHDSSCESERESVNDQQSGQDVERDQDHDHDQEERAQEPVHKKARRSGQEEKQCHHCRGVGMNDRSYGHLVADCQFKKASDAMKTFALAADLSAAKHEAAVKEIRDQHAEEMAALEAKYKKLKAKKVALVSEHDEEVRLLKQQADDMAKSFEGERKQLKSAQDLAVDKVRREYERTIGRLQEKHSQVLKRTVKKAVKKLKAEYNSSLSKAATDHEEAIAAIQEMQALKTECEQKDEALASLQAHHATELEAQKNEHADQLRRLVRKVQALKAEVAKTSKRAEEYASVARDAVAHMVRTHHQHEELLKQEEDQHRDTLEEIRDRNVATVNQMRKEHSATVERMREEHHAAMEAKDQAAREEEDKTVDVQAKAESYRRDHQRAIKASLGHFIQELFKIKQDFTRYMDRVREQNPRELAKLTQFYRDNQALVDDPDSAEMAELDEWYWRKVGELLDNLSEGTHYKEWESVIDQTPQHLWGSLGVLNSEHRDRLKRLTDGVESVVATGDGMVPLVDMDWVTKECEEWKERAQDVLDEMVVAVQGKLDDMEEEVQDDLWRTDEVQEWWNLADRDALMKKEESNAARLLSERWERMAEARFGYESESTATLDGDTELDHPSLKILT